MIFPIFTLFLLSKVHSISSENQMLLTQTVYGFLDFTTTIGNTVMVFSPQSSPKIEIQTKNNSNVSVNIIDTKPLSNNIYESKNGIKPTKSTMLVELKPISTNSKSQIKESSSSKEKAERNEIQNSSISNVSVKSSVNYPEYDLLSRQPEEFAEESFRVVNIRSSANEERHKAVNPKKDAQGSRPIGLVTKISGMQLSNGSRTIHETSVLGTYISGKYAQILQTASIISPEKRVKPRSSSSFRVLKTASPTSSNSKEPSVRRNSKHRKNAKSSVQQTVQVETATETNTRKSSRHKGKRRNKNSKSIITPTSSLAGDSSPRRAYRTKSPNVVVPESESSSSQYSFKLNRRPGRWQYKSSPKPKVNIRKQASNITTTNQLNETLKKAELPAQNSDEIISQNFVAIDRDLDALGSQNGAITKNDANDVQKNFVQTLNVEISTPDNFIDTYYEIATIKSPFIFQAGVVKKTRFITVTSTIEKIIRDEPTETYSEADGPLTENILESSKSTKGVLDGSITSLNAIHLTDTNETPQLETLTESYTLTNTKLKTQILPIIYDKDNATVLMTLVQTFDYSSLITVTRTISPSNDDFSPSLGFKDFEGSLDEAGSEINLELEFGDEDNAEKFEERISPKNKNNDNKENSSQSGTRIEQNVNYSDAQQLALHNLLSQTAVLPSFITTTRPVVKLSTLWESHVVPLIKGTQTILRTLSKSIGVVEKTEFIVDTSTIPAPLPQNPFSINPYFNPLLPVQQPQLITSSEVQHTSVTQTNSKVLKLTFGARTAYTTIFSTQVVPTILTKIVTTAFPLQPSAAFPNYFPPPYPPFAYVG